MKKVVKWVLILMVTSGVLLIGLFGYLGNEVYRLALDPSSDKSMFASHLDQSVVSLSDDLLAQSEDVYINTDTGMKLHSYQFTNTSNIWVIAVHGYMGQGSLMGWAITHFQQQGYNVLAPDLRGHGLSEGEYIGMGWDDRLDIMSWIDYIVTANPQADIILYGVSMGAATVLNVGGEKLPDNVKVIIEDSGYTTAEEVFSYHLNNTFEVPKIPILESASIVTKLRAGYSISEGPIYQLQKCKLPILFIHGKKDTLVPFEMLDTLYKSYQGPKERLVNDTAGHVQAVLVDQKTYWNTVDAFIKKHLS